MYVNEQRLITCIWYQIQGTIWSKTLVLSLISEVVHRFNTKRTLMKGQSKGPLMKGFWKNVDEALIANEKIWSKI